MRRISIAGLLLAGVFSVGSHDVSACGDKFLLVGRGARYQRAYCALHPASILVYINPKSPRAGSMGSPEFLNALTLAGHKPQTVASLGRFVELLSAGPRYDIVLAEFPDAKALGLQLQPIAAKPLLLPIMYKPAKAEQTAAEQQFGTVLKAPDSIMHFLGVIDDAMKARLRAVKTAT